MLKPRRKIADQKSKKRKKIPIGQIKDETQVESSESAEDTNGYQKLKLKT